MNIVTNGNYCVKCHAVADFQPQGDPNTFGPNLADVYRRLRPKFTRDWIANPARILPYTGMPVNIPYRSGRSAPGRRRPRAVSWHQHRAVQRTGRPADEFRRVRRRQTSVSSLVKEPPAAAAPPARRSLPTETPTLR